jgi:hypothetical protein
MLCVGGLLPSDKVAAAEELVSVAVVDFSSSSHTSYRKSLPEFVVNELVNRGDFDVLEREKLDTVVSEVAFQANSGFVTPDSAVRVGGMLGAKILITGHILDHGQETQRYTGYGISTTKITYRLKARIEAVDVTTGSKLFSHVAGASKQSQTVQGQSYDTTQKDLGEKIAKELVDALMASKRIKTLVGGVDAISVLIVSEPEEADVEVDGTYYGTAGQPIQLIPGLHNVAVSLPGYLTWSKRVMVQQGTSIKARLQKDETQRSATKIELEVN